MKPKSSHKRRKRQTAALAPFKPNVAARILLDIHSAITGIRASKTGPQLGLLRRWHDATHQFHFSLPCVVRDYVASHVPNLNGFLVIMFRRKKDGQIQEADVWRQGSGQPLLLKMKTPDESRVLGDDVFHDGWKLVVPAKTTHLQEVAADPALALLWREDDLRTRAELQRVRHEYRPNPPRIEKRADAVVDVVRRLTVPREVRDDATDDPALRAALIQINDDKSPYPTVWPDIGANIADIRHDLTERFPGIPENDVFVAIEFARNDGRIKLLEGSFGRYLSKSRTKKFFCNDAIWVVPTQQLRVANNENEAGRDDARADREHLAGPVHSLDFRSARWFGVNHTFTANQAVCVKLLWEAWERGTPDVGDASLLEAAEVSESQRLRDVFKGHPAWGAMILEGEKKGTHHLRELDEPSK